LHVRIPAEHAVLIDIDAFNPEYLELAETPTIDALVQYGSLSRARGVYKSFSNPARSSIITGAWPATHGNQAYYYDAARDLAIGQEHPYEDLAATPLAAQTVAQTLADQGRTVVGVEYRNLDRHGISTSDPEHLLCTPGGDCATRIDAAIEVVRHPVGAGGTGRVVPRIPDLLAIYLKDFDDLGHAEGPDSPRIPGLVERLDHQLGRLVNAFDAAGIADRTVFILVSDHGMVSIAEPILPDLLRLLDGTGFTYDVVREGARPSAGAEIVVMATSRNADLTLRGAADTEDGRGRVAEAVSKLDDRVIVHQHDSLAELRATHRIGQLVVEAVPPYHLSPDLDRPAGGGHGGSAEKDVALIISGAAIRPGAQPVGACLVDVAPTICALLDARPPAQAEGRALTELFAA
jgi:arylsulfatase A-like enzyme